MLYCYENVKYKNKMNCQKALKSNKANKKVF